MNTYICLQNDQSIWKNVSNTIKFSVIYSTAIHLFSDSYYNCVFAYLIYSTESYRSPYRIETYHIPLMSITEILGKFIVSQFVSICRCIFDKHY